MDVPGGRRADEASGADRSQPCTCRQNRLKRHFISRCERSHCSHVVSALSTASLQSGTAHGRVLCVRTGRNSRPPWLPDGCRVVVAGGQADAGCGPGAPSSAEWPSVGSAAPSSERPRFPCSCMAKAPTASRGLSMGLHGLQDVGNRAFVAGRGAACTSGYCWG